MANSCQRTNNSKIIKTNHKMKINTLMPTNIIPFYKKELEAYKNNLQKKYLQLAWYHLERAHIIGQKYPYEHTFVHWKMLQFGIKIKSFREVLGQIPRLLVGGVKSFVGHIPIGNTGGANVSPLKPMEIPKDIQKIISMQNINATIQNIKQIS